MRISLCAIVLLPSVCESFKEMPKCTQEYRDTFTATMKFCEGIESIACRLIRDAITWAKKLSADEVSFLREFIKNELNKTTHFRGYAETFLRNKWVPDVNLSLSTSGCSATKNDTKDLICQEIFFRCNASEEVEPFKRICNEIAMEIDRANRPTLPPKKEDEPKKAGMSIYVFVGAGAAAFVVVAAVLFFIVFRRRRLQRRSSHTAKELDLSSQSGTPSPADSTAKTGSNAAQIGRQLERKSGTERAGKANGNN